MNDAIISRLADLATKCENPLQKAEIDAQIAYHASRMGSFKLAHDLLSRIRADPVVNSGPKVAVWTILVDGVLSFFENLDPSSRDRFRRAHALSIALGMRDLRSLAAAWLAHAEFVKCDYEAMANAANDCIGNLAPLGDMATSRIGLVLASAYLFSGDFKNSQIWFELARKSALLEGDRSTIGAILYNRAAMALACFRVSNCTSRVDELDIGFVASSVASATNFNSITKNLALSDLVSMCEARLAIVEGRYHDAANTLERILNSRTRSLAGAKDRLADLEYLACLTRLRHVERAEFDAYNISLEASTQLEVDDRIVFLTELQRMYLYFGDSSLNYRLTNLLVQAGAAYDADIFRLQTALQKVGNPNTISVK